MADSGETTEAAAGGLSASAPGRDRLGDHGWWPYLMPYLGFMLAIEVAARVPGWLQPAMLVLKPGVPAALIVYFALKGRYPELRGFRPYAGLLWLDVVVGLALTVVWMAPLLAGIDLGIASFFSAEWLERPGPGEGFEPYQLGERGVALTIALRFAGFALVTPVFEELFIRSFVMRYAEVFSRSGDFRTVPIAHFSRRSFWVTTLLFTLAHAPWEWSVAVLWVALSSLWFYWRGHIVAVIVVHAVTNAAILVYVVALNGELPGSGGDPIDLWIFL